MKRNLLTLLTALILTGTSIAPSWAASASELLEQGIYNEESVGDLQAAIKVYEKIVNDAKADRTAIANALFRLGMCHQKLGQQVEAKSSLETLVRDYSEQTKLVTEANQMLNHTKMILERLSKLEHAQKLFDDYYKWLVHMALSWRAESEDFAKQNRSELQEVLPKLEEQDSDLAQFVIPKLEPLHEAMLEALNGYIKKNRRKGNTALAKGTKIAESINERILERVELVREQLFQTMPSAKYSG